MGNNRCSLVGINMTVGSMNLAVMHLSIGQTRGAAGHTVLHRVARGAVCGLWRMPIWIVLPIASTAVVTLMWVALSRWHRRAAPFHRPSVTGSNPPRCHRRLDNSG